MSNELEELTSQLEKERELRRRAELEIANTLERVKDSEALARAAENAKIAAQAIKDRDAALDDLVMEKQVSENNAAAADAMQARARLAEAELAPYKETFEQVRAQNIQFANDAMKAEAELKVEKEARLEQAERLRLAEDALANLHQYSTKHPPEADDETE